MLHINNDQSIKKNEKHFKFYFLYNFIRWLASKPAPRTNVIDRLRLANNHVVCNNITYQMTKGYLIGQQLAN